MASNFSATAVAASRSASTAKPLRSEKQRRCTCPVCGLRRGPGLQAPPTQAQNCTWQPNGTGGGVGDRTSRFWQPPGCKRESPLHPTICHFTAKSHGAQWGTTGQLAPHLDHDFIGFPAALMGEQRVAYTPNVHCQSFESPTPHLELRTSSDLEGIFFGDSAAGLLALPHQQGCGQGRPGGHAAARLPGSMPGVHQIPRVARDGPWRSARLPRPAWRLRGSLAVGASHARSLPTVPTPLVLASPQLGLAFGSGANR